ncbi:hypothetical protein SAZ10_12790 [Mesorhizobium sp. BAC0120]|uniref:hypothetical protein n=1 Tax=Mesorhizobium sp. BAC0120 TaxID=3090670 RepID=UPI00298BC950|nr:hypothetical protein [Mesorhizobium sp. BAC0120]MDW6022632.1 hypothetical protein [Mesorhizobium sp. BAC0120]
MKPLVLLAVCAGLAACSQTAAPSQTAAANPAPAAKAPGKGSLSQPKTAATQAAACEDAVKKQANTAMLGSALGMAGGLVGFGGGRGGAVAAQLASTAGSVVTQAQSSSAQSAVERDCYAQNGDIW